jgi:hypothetical protein
MSKSTEIKRTLCQGRGLHKYTQKMLNGTSPLPKPSQRSKSRSGRKRLNIWIPLELADLVHDHIIHKLIDNKGLESIAFAHELDRLARLGLAIEHLHAINCHKQSYDELLKYIVEPLPS